MKELCISDLRVKVIFEDLIKGVETRYGNQNEWNEVYEDRGKFESRAGVLRTQGENPVPITTHVLYVRFRDDFNPRYRVGLDGRYFRIINFNILDVGKKRYHEISLDEEKVEI